MSNQSHNHPFFSLLPMLPPFAGRPDGYHANEAPVRVRVAMEWVEQCTDKTANDVAANDVGFEEIDGQALDVEEQQALRAACRLLTDYFEGRLMPTPWEAEMLNRQQKAPFIGPCPRCRGDQRRQVECRECGGRGEVIFQP